VIFERREIEELFWGLIFKCARFGFEVYEILRSITKLREIESFLEVEKIPQGLITFGWEK
jgi:hypothetical protein